MSSSSPQTAAPNRLIHESSPYLLQHAHNPVHWYPWGPEALEKARREDKPIFLSIGYSTCHWCHVMERECFEDEAIAALLNEGFVAIKVDREERPDLDALYMEAVQMMTGSGGWPLSVFLTPQGEPFFGGTYFPPESRWGQPGFRDVLTSIHQAWSSGQRNKLLEFSGKLRLALEQEARVRQGDLNAEWVDQVVERFLGVFDAENGGFGRAPKFPQAGILMLLLQVGRRTGDATGLNCVTQTLEAMARGGIYDQLAGGFHRYSVDAQWRVPHFEKMLYDQAQLATVYAWAARLTGRQDFEATARGVLDFVLNDMTSPEGAFYTALDADSDGQEGRAYLWRPEQIRAALPPEQAEWALRYWQVTDREDVEGLGSVLTVTRAPMTTAPLNEVRAALLAVRRRRVQPARDEKVLLAWNAMTVQSLAVAGRWLDESRYTQAAVTAAEWLRATLKVDGQWRRVWTAGHIGGPAYLEDHAWLLEAFIELYETTLQVTWLEEALQTAEVMEERFADPNGGPFYRVAVDAESLMVRQRDLDDGALPSANAVAAGALVRLMHVTHDEHWGTLAESVLRGVTADIENRWGGRFAAVRALDLLVHPDFEVVIAGPESNQEAARMLQLVQQSPRAGLVWARVATGNPDSDAGRVSAGLATYGTASRQAMAYVCQGFVCQQPVETAAALVERLGGESSANSESVVQD